LSCSFCRSTIHLAGGEADRRVHLVAQGIPENHPNGNVIEVRNSKVTGDSTGEYAGALKTVDVNFEENNYTLHVVIPNA
jgi:hypothetical protein